MQVTKITDKTLRKQKKIFHGKGKVKNPGFWKSK